MKTIENFISAWNFSNYLSVASQELDPTLTYKLDESDPSSKASLKPEEGGSIDTLDFTEKQRHWPPEGAPVATRSFSQSDSSMISRLLPLEKLNTLKGKSSQSNSRLLFRLLTLEGQRNLTKALPNSSRLLIGARNRSGNPETNQSDASILISN